MSVFLQGQRAEDGGRSEEPRAWAGGRGKTPRGGTRPAEGSGRGSPPLSIDPSRLRAGNSIFQALPVQFFQQAQSAFRVASRGSSEKRRFDFILRDNHSRRRIGHLINALAAAFSFRLVLHPLLGNSGAVEIVFSITQESDGGYVAECLSHDIFTQANTGEDLRANVREAVSAFFFDQPKPTAVRLHLVRDELLAGA